MRWVRGAGLLCGVACGDPDPADSGSGAPAGPDLFFTDANNYTFTAVLDLASTDLQAGADVQVDWSGIDTDYRGRPVDPLAVDQVTLAAIGLPPDQLIEAINANALLMEQIDGYYQVLTSEQSSASFSEFAILGNNFPFAAEFVEGFSPSWLLTIWTTGPVGNFEILSSQFVVPVEGATATTIGWSNDAAQLDFDPDLTQPGVLAAAEQSSYSLDWSAVTTDVNGAPFDVLKADTLRISHLPVESRAEAEEVLLRLDQVADQVYLLDVFALREVPDLSVAISEDDSFPGFTTDGIWVISIECTLLACFSPAPLLLGVVEVE